MRLKAITTILIAFVFIQLLHAQENVGFDRQGFIFGSAAGIANTNLTYPDRAQNFLDVGIEFHLGYMIKPQLAILLSSNVAVYDYSGLGRDRKRDFGILAPSVRYWFKNKIWIQGGVGVGGDNPVFWDIKNPDNDPLEIKYYSGLGLNASMGYELFQSKKNFTIDLQARTMFRKVNLPSGKTICFFKLYLDKSF